MINRLAAAHRGTLRALQVAIHHLSDLSHSKVPSHYKELGQLIRQLSQCSAKVEMDHGSAVPETAVNILQKLEVKNITYIQKAFIQCYVCLAPCSTQGLVAHFRGSAVLRKYSGGTN